MAKERPWGPDVSHHQGTVDWRKVKEAGASFAAAKATEGLRGLDREFARNWPAMFKAGIKIRIAYHYAHIESDPYEQARHFVSTVREAGRIGRGDFLALDAEDVCKTSYRISPGATADWCQKFLNEVVRLTGLPRKRVLVYTGQWWWTPRTGGDDGPAKTGHPLWLSGYVSDEKKLSSRPWRVWRFWQYTNGTNPRVISTPGIGRCDRNVFNGTYRGLWWLSGRSLSRLLG